MSEHAQPTMEELRARTGRLSELLAEQTQRTRRKQRTYLAAGILLVLACSVFLFSLTTTVSKLDAEALTQMARLTVEQHLPGGRENVRSYLQQEAPHVVSYLLRSFVDMLPELRKVLVDGITDKLSVANTELEKELIAQLEKSAATARVRIDQAYPDAPEAEKLEKLIAQVATDFTAGIDVAATEMYPHYAAEMHRIRSYLEELQHTQPEDLTARQRTHKEILETLLRLMIRESEG